MKTILLCASLLFISSFSFSQTEIQSGKFSYGPSTPGYTLHQNSGERSVTVEVAFEKGFDKKPKIVLAVNSFDGDTKSNVRYRIEAVSISRDGFSIKVTTWSETKVLSIGGDWIAYAQ